MDQKCIIIRRDEQGFGLRVSGDNPVTVDYVKPHGAAYKAGVKAGQVIVKVNGTHVFKQSHLKVVQMIRECQHHVALTVQDSNFPNSCPTTPSISPPPSAFVPTTTPGGAVIIRSESLKQRRESKPSYRKHSDPALPCNHSNANIGSPEELNEYSPESVSCDVDNENEPLKNDREGVLVPPPLPPRSTIRSVIKSSKRQDIINELFETEKTHVEYLNVLNYIFYQPIRREQLLISSHIEAIFSTHDKLLDIHKRILEKFSLKWDSHMACIQQQLTYPQKYPNPITEMNVGGLLVDIFDGVLGKELEHAASVFCASQTAGLEILNKLKMKKDSKFVAFLNEAESHERCKRLDLKAILACCFQRLTKYPLLLENLLKETKPGPEYDKIARAFKRSKEILHVINESKRKAEYEQRIVNIARKVEKQSGLSLDFSDKVLVHEGLLTWRITKQKCIDVLVVLCTDVLVILGRDNDRLTLKQHTNPINNNKHSPILKVNDLFTRDVATDKTAFFLISTNENAVYEFAAASSNEKDIWNQKIKEISSTDKLYSEQGRSVTKLIDLTTKREGEDKVEEKKEEKDSYPVCSRIEGTISYVTDDEMPLISPEALQVIDIGAKENVEEACKIVTPEEKLNRLDLKINELVNEKYILIQEILRIKDEKEWAIITDVSQHDRFSFATFIPLIQKTMELTSYLAVNARNDKLDENDIINVYDCIEQLLDKCKHRRNFTETQDSWIMLDCRLTDGDRKDKPTNEPMHKRHTIQNSAFDTSTESKFNTQSKDDSDDCIEEGIQNEDDDSKNDSKTDVGKSENGWHYF